MDALARAPERRREAFNYFAELQGVERCSRESPLRQLLPSLGSIESVSDSDVRSSLDEAIQSLNQDQTKAFESLRCSTSPLFFLSGCPGGGKTHWALQMAAIAQASNPKVRVLYLLDINKGVNDVALRMMNVYKAHGMKKSVIRMHGWPQEVRMSEKADQGKERNGSQASKEKENGDKTSTESKKENSKEDTNRMVRRIPDFAGSFLKHSSHSQEVEDASNDPCLRAPSLDEAAWKLFEASPSEFKRIQNYLSATEAVYKNEEKHQVPDMDSFRKHLEPLYAAAISHADFIATTPVAAAQAYFAEKFQPDIIFFDEAAHARELATLIPIAYFNSKVCVYLGDHRQLKPHVHSTDEICQQLEVSTLLRAVYHKAIATHLLVNHRARGGLHQLPSNLFYGGRMVSGFSDNDAVPKSTAQLVQFMNQYRYPASNSPRMLVSDSSSWWIKSASTSSSFNLFHERGIMKLMGDLLEAPWFTSVDGQDPGTILVVTPMLASFRRYRRHVRKLDTEHQGRIEIRTMSTAAGAQADVVFIDIVKPSDFVDDRHRLCVALTRAVQGEFIFMSRKMRYVRLTKDGRKPSIHLDRIWTHCEMHHEVVEIFGRGLRYSLTWESARSWVESLTKASRLNGTIRKG